MKTKHLLFSTIVGAGALVSCTNEELIDNSNVNLAGEKINIEIAANKSGFAYDSRVGIDADENGSLAGQPYWQATDKLGGLLFVDPNGESMLTNYPFVPTEEIGEGEKPTSMTFKTPTAVSKGTYVFYTPYKSEYVSNETFNVELADRQEMDPANPTAHLSDYNFMISPTVDIAGIPYGETGAVNELPIQFKSIYNYTRLKITLKEASEPVTIQRIVFKHGSMGSNFKSSVNIVPEKIRAIVNNIGEKWSDGKTKDESSVVITADGDINASKAIASDYILASDNFEVYDDASVALLDRNEKAKTITLYVKGGATIKAGETFNAYVLLPYGTYTEGVKYDIYTDKGVTENKVIKPTDGKLVLKAGKTAFASCELNYTMNSNSFVTPTTFDISDAADWNEAVAFVSENFSLYGSTTDWQAPTFHLLKDVKGELPDFKVNVTAENGCKLTLEGENKLEAATAANLSNVDVVNEGKLTIEKYDTNNTTGWTINSLENKGEVTVNGKLALTTTLVNKGKFNNAGIVTVTGATSNGDPTDKPAAVLTNTGNITFTGALNNYENSVINVNNTASGTGFSINATSANNAKASINIADKAEMTIAAGKTFTNTGTITLNNAAKINNSTSATLTNTNGTIIITDASRDYKMPAVSDGIVKTSVSTLDGINAAQQKVGSVADKNINMIELTSSIKVEAALDMANADLCLGKDVKLEINNGVTVTCEDLLVSGTGASVAAYDKAGNLENPNATLKAGSISVNEGASFVNDKSILIGDACTSITVGKNASLTNAGEIQAHTALETTIKVSVAENGKLTNTKDGKLTNAKFNITANNGSIINQSETAIKVAGSMVGNMSGKFTFTANT